MATTGFEALDPASVNTGISNLKAFASEGGPPPDFFEGQGTLELTTLKAACVAKSQAGAAKPGDFKARLEANYAAALYRDALSAVAGRRMLQAFGVHNHFRNLYEGCKLHIDSTSSS